MNGASDEKRSTPLGGTIRPQLLEGLPQPLALLLHEYDQEHHPYVKLHRICECAEMLVRFVVAVLLAEIRRSNPDRSIPPVLRPMLLGDENTSGLERPSFGDWLKILNGSLTQLPPQEHLCVPELRGFATRILELVTPHNHCVQNAIYDLRNALAHDGRFSRERAVTHLDQYGHRTRFERFWHDDANKFLCELQLWGLLSPDHAVLLRGVMNHPADGPISSMPVFLAGGSPVESPIPGSLILTRESRRGYLQLLPLYVIGRIYERPGKDLVPITEEPATQAYCRQGEWVEYTALHDYVGRGYATPQFQQEFERLFPLKQWRRQIERAVEASRLAEEEQQRLRGAAQPYSFRDVVKPLLDTRLVGRAHEIETILTWIEGHDAGNGLVLGLPGTGKSALAAHVAGLIPRQHRDWLCLRYFFRTGDPRCSGRSFMEGILLQLQLRGGKRMELPADPVSAQDHFHEALLGFSHAHVGLNRKFAKLVLVVDGLDEIGGLDPNIFSLFRSTHINGVIWLCLGRPVPLVVDQLPDEVAERVFPGEGLPPLRREDVRDYLVEELGRRKYDFFASESDSGQSAFLAAVSERARSLPLYLRLLSEDLRRGDFDFRRPDRLPRSLDDYYGRLIQQFDAAGTTLPHVIALLALAHRPLSTDMLQQMLSDDPLAEDPDWTTILDAALRLGHVLTRQGYIWEGLTGYILYHESFREYLLEMEKRDYSSFSMAPVLHAARRRMLRFCERWREWPADSPSRRYAIAFYPKHLAESNHWDGLVSLLTDPDYLEAKLEAGLLFDLVSDCRNAVCRLAADHPFLVTLTALLEGLQRNADFLQERPCALFQCLWNLFAGTADSGSAHEPGSIASLLRHWRSLTESRGLAWIRAIYPLWSGLGDEITHSGHQTDIVRLVVSGCGRRFAAMSFGFFGGQQMGRITAGLVAGGRLLTIEPVPDGMAVPLAFGPGGKHLLIGTDNAVQVWDVDRQTISQELPVPDANLVAALPAVGHRSVRVLTADGRLWSWNGPGCSWEVATLLNEEVLVGDEDTHGSRWLLVTCAKEAVLLESSQVTARVCLPTDLEPLPSTHDLAGIPLPRVVPSRWARFAPVAPPSLAKYSRLLNLILACSAAARSIAVLSSVEPEWEESDLFPLVNDKVGCRLWRMESPSELRAVCRQGACSTVVAFHPEGTMVAVGFNTGHVYLSPLRDGVTESRGKPLDKPATAIAFTPDGRQILQAGSAEMQAAIVSGPDGVGAIPVGGGSTVHVTALGLSGDVSQPHETTVTATARSPDGRFFATADESGRIALWDAAGGCSLHVHIPRRRFYWPEEREESPDFGRLVEVDFWTSESKDTGHMQPVRFLAFTSDSRFLISSSVVGDCWIWDAESLRPVDNDVLHEDSEDREAHCSAALSPDGRFFAQIDRGGDLAVWSVGECFEEVLRRTDLKFSVAGVAFSHDARHLAVWEGERVRVISIPEAKDECSFPVPPSPHAPIAFFTPPASWIGLRESLRELRAELHGTEPPATPFGGAWLLAGSLTECSLRIWYLDEGRELMRVGLPGMPNEIAVSTGAQSGFAVSAGVSVKTFQFPDREAILAGSGDLHALAEGPARYPIRVMQRDERTEVELADTGQLLAVYPLPLDHIVMHPDGNTWCGINGRDVHILRFEGVERRS